MKITPFAIAAAAVMVVALSLRVQSQDRVKTKAGTEHLGRVLDATVDPLLFENTDGMPVPIMKHSIESIETLKSAYASLGATLLMPGIINVNCGYTSDGWGLRVAGGTLFDDGTYGVQLNAVRNITRSPSFVQSVSIGIVQSELVTTEYYSFLGNITRVRTWTAFGVYYDFNWHGFFLEAGCTFGKGSYSSPQLSLQVGYVYQFQWRKWAGMLSPASDNP